MRTETAYFRLIHAPCCGTLLCCVNPRLYNYCPECGSPIYAKLKTNPSLILEKWPAVIKEVKQ